MIFSAKYFLSKRDNITVIDLLKVQNVFFTQCFKD